MKVTFENPEKVSGKLTLVVEEADYKNEYEKALKDYRKRANIPGFRPGQAPMGMIKRQIGPSVLVDTLNKLVGNELYKYVQENKIDMLGEPLPNSEQEQVDLDKPAPYTFVFDLAIAPELNVELTEKDVIPYYTIKVDDTLIDQQVNAYASRGGSYAKVEEYQDNDMLKGDLRELDAAGNTVEGGITVSEAVIMPKYVKNADEAKKFDGCKLGDIITFNPRNAYESDAELAALLKVEKEEVADKTSDYSYQITEISRYTPHAIDEELFEQTYPGAEIKTEAAFRERVAKEIEQQLAQNSEFRFLADLRAYCEKQAGEVKYADDLMKRIMLANNKDKGMDYVEKNYEGSVKELTWHLLKNKIAQACGVKVEDDDVKAAAKEMARVQFAQYGMTNIPEEYLDNYAQETLKKQENIDMLVERAVDVKLVAAVKALVKLDSKEVSLDEFNKLGAE